MPTTILVVLLGLAMAERGQILKDIIRAKDPIDPDDRELNRALTSTPHLIARNSVMQHFGRLKVKYAIAMAIVLQELKDEHLLQKHYNEQRHRPNPTSEKKPPSCTSPGSLQG